ncbi:MAG: tRNA pseudouridine(38-40) synthase TruA, partial [Candidatus Pacebacteria bacterium]|nr:tRNA pseudouridine(38-40) synthase TruA [Candidatus Paceibacterota bacterium]
MNETPPAHDNWHLTLEYNGTAYHGWQIQPHHPTIQRELQSRMRLLFQDPELCIAGTSRTDAGVHALDQHVSFTTTRQTGLDVESLRTKLNRWLPADIHVTTITREPPGFHARHSALAKAYTYVIDTTSAPN